MPLVTSGTSALRSICFIDIRPHILSDRLIWAFRSSRLIVRALTADIAQIFVEELHVQRNCSNGMFVHCIR